MRSRNSFICSVSNWLLVWLLLLLPGCSGIFSGPSEYEQAQRVEQGFSDVISAAGGAASKEGRSMHGFEDAGWFIDLSNGTITDELISAIVEAAQADPVFDLNLSGSNITDDQLAALDEGKALQKVFILDLSNTAISDSGLDRVTNVHCLDELKLTGANATAAGAQRLGERKVAHEQTPDPFKTQPDVEI